MLELAVCSHLLNRPVTVEAVFSCGSRTRSPKWHRAVSAVVDSKDREVKLGGADAGGEQVGAVSRYVSHSTAKCKPTELCAAGPGPASRGGMMSHQSDTSLNPDLVSLVEPWDSF